MQVGCCSSVVALDAHTAFLLQHSKLEDLGSIVAELTCSAREVTIVPMKIFNEFGTLYQDGTQKPSCCSIDAFQSSLLMLILPFCCSIANWRILAA